MSNTLGINYSDDLAEITNDMGQTVTIEGTSYAAAVGSPSAGYNADDPSGWHADNSLQVLISYTVLDGATVAEGDKVTYGSKVYRIVTAQPDEFGHTLKLTCEEETA